MDFFGAKGPTAEQLEGAGLVAVTTYEEIDTAIKNDQGPLRKFLNGKFPPVTQGYVTKPVVPSPSATTFTAKQTGPEEITVSWSGFSPIELARNGVDINGAENWNTGTLTDQPTSGSFAFDFLVVGDTYEFTATITPASSVAATCEVTGPPAPTLPTLGINGATDATSLAQMKALGAKYVRSQVTWNYGPQTFFNADGSYDTTVTEQANAVSALAQTLGLTVLWLIDGFVSSATPPTTGVGNYTEGLPHTPQAYADAVAWFASQVKGAHIELVNEPNGYAQWNGSVPLTASDFATALPLVYAKAKAADPTCFIHMAPVSGVNSSALTWRQSLLAALPSFAEYIDFDGWHFYTYPDNEPPSSLVGQAATFIESAGVTKPSWVTEGGYQSLTTDSGNGLPEMTPALQAEYLPQLIDLIVGTELVEAFFIYCLQDYGTGSGAGYWGLIDQDAQNWGPDADESPKPAFAVIQNLFTKGS